MKEKENKRGQNTITIYATVELKQFVEKVKHDQKKNLLYNAHFVARDFLLRYKDVFVKMFGKKKFEEESKIWSRTQNEIRDENKRKKEQAIKRKEEKLKLDKERLEVWKASIGYEEEETEKLEVQEPKPYCPKCGRELIKWITDGVNKWHDKPYCCKKCDVHFEKDKVEWRPKFD